MLHSLFRGSVIIAKEKKIKQRKTWFNELFIQKVSQHLKQCPTADMHAFHRSKKYWWSNWINALKNCLWSYSAPIGILVKLANYALAFDDSHSIRLIPCILHPTLRVMFFSKVSSRTACIFLLISRDSSRVMPVLALVTSPENMHGCHYSMLLGELHLVCVSFRRS